VYRRGKEGEDMKKIASFFIAVIGSVLCLAFWAEGAEWEMFLQTDNNKTFHYVDLKSMNHNTYENIVSARIKKLLLKPYRFRANDKDVQMGLAHFEVSCEFKKFRFKGATILVYEDGTKKEIRIKYLWKDITSDDIEGYRKYLCEKVR
jgi:hypothetical protein